MIVYAAQEYFHQRPDQYKSYPGWQEPGLWRPKWVMDREFQKEDGSIGRDRIYFKLKSERTVKIFHSKKRPFLEWRKKTSEKDKKKLFESGEEELPDTAEQMKTVTEQQEELYNVDGTWWWADESPAPTGKVKIETREGPLQERVRHETRCDWGQLDGYAAKFRRGRIYKFKGVKKGSDIPIGQYVAGTFSIRSNVHRPIVSKDFLAFQ